MSLSPRALIRVAFALLWAVGAALLPAPAAHAGDDGLIREEVTFRGGGGLTLHGTVLTSRTTQASGTATTRRALRASGTARAFEAPPGARPGIVLVGGSGPGPREEYRQEAEAFARAGITTLVYDKRTVQYSTMHRDFGLLTEDALAGVRLLRNRAGVDPRRVGLWGFSEGGWVAPMAAARSSDVAYVITIGGSGHSPLRSQVWNLTTHLRHRGVTGSFLSATTGPAAQLVDSTGLFPEADRDVLPALKRLRRTPVLALWGAYDNQVPPQESARIFQRTLAEVGNDHVVLRFVPGAAHNGHRTSDGFDRIGGPSYRGKRLGALPPGYVHTMTSWVRAVASGHPPRSSAAPALPQAIPSTPVSGAWYARAVPALLLLGFAAYPVGGMLRRITSRKRPRPRTGRCVRLFRWLAGLGFVAVVGAVLAPLAIFVLGDGAAAPVVAGRPVGWLVVQGLSVAVVVVLCVTAAAVIRERREWRALGAARWMRSTVVLVTAAGFVPWALWWGVLRP
ncbi:prolyl oligopeptidase family serine peptidase [Streptomyces sp. NPDC048506]|uniref:alpha/beta hydrolase family protein n=1 Tax=Streptomyces sp. NPDC048506 TaxID=3155028 RepID=UPI00342C6366